jgi:hypothetical protein
MQKLLASRGHGAIRLKHRPRSTPLDSRILGALRDRIGGPTASAQKGASRLGWRQELQAELDAPLTSSRNCSSVSSSSLATYRRTVRKTPRRLPAGR